MSGWKTKLGALLIAGSGAAQALGHTDIATLILSLGSAFGLLGAVHKIEKAGDTIAAASSK